MVFSFGAALDFPARGDQTNAPASFLDSHPELNVPTPGDQPNLSFRPGTSTNAPPQVSPPSAEYFPQDVGKSNPMGQPDDLAAHLLVVYNSNDPDSREIANYYAAQRSIAADHVLGINTSSLEEISRPTYENTIRVPILSYLTGHDWLARRPERVLVQGEYTNLLVATRNDIWAMVLIRGVPLKVASEPGAEYTSLEQQPEFHTDAASVDSELALLPIFGLPLGGFVPSIFFDEQFSGIKRVGPDLARNMILVTRLDGPTPADVHRMIDDSIAAEKIRLAGMAVVDTRGLTDIKNGYTVGDTWLRYANVTLQRAGWSIEFDDKPGLIPASDPCNQVALYLGWYAETASGPWVTPPNRFVPGAIAYHLHSFSASTVRSATSHWVGPLIAHGAAATMGTVYEPYLALTPHEDIFTRRILRGDYFCEAAWASESGLSWMFTAVGDPLYRPFHLPLNAALAMAKMPHSDHDDWLLLQKVQREIIDQQVAMTPAALKTALEIPGAGPVAEEGLGDILQRIKQPAAIAAAEEAYRKAAAVKRETIDRIRVGLKLAQLYSDHGEAPRAQAELETLRQLDPVAAKAFGVPDRLVPTSQPAKP